MPDRGHGPRWGDPARSRHGYSLMDGEHGPLDTPIVVMATVRRSPGGDADVVLAHVRPSRGLSRREGRKPLCDLGIPAFGCVLTAHGRAGGSAESAHELGQRGAG